MPRVVSHDRLNLYLFLMILDVRIRGKSSTPELFCCHARGRVSRPLSLDVRICGKHSTPELFCCLFVYIIMSVHSLRIVQKIPITIKEAWDFFAHPANLQLITPSDFQFNILTKLEDRPIYSGQIIDYTVRPLFKIRMRWTTIITQVDEGVLFIDEQQRGPFRYWQHTHHFRPVEEGTEMIDELKYEIPGWFVGDIINAVLIRNDLKKLFDYRYSKIAERFGSL